MPVLAYRPDNDDTLGAAKVFIPSIEDRILTKRIGGRPKDAEDIRLLQRLKEVQE